MIIMGAAATMVSISAFATYGWGDRVCFVTDTSIPFQINYFFVQNVKISTTKPSQPCDIVPNQNLTLVGIARKMVVV